MLKLFYYMLSEDYDIYCTAKPKMLGNKMQDMVFKSTHTLFFYERIIFVCSVRLKRVFIQLLNLLTNSHL